MHGTFVHAVAEPHRPEPAFASAVPGGPDNSALEHLPDGRVRRRDLGSADRTIAVCTHLWWILLLTPLGFLALAVPLVTWLGFRGRNHFVADHGLEALNLMISLFIQHVLLAVTVIGIAFWPVLWIYTIVGIVRASIAAGNGEYFRYPATFRLL